MSGIEVCIGRLRCIAERCSWRTLHALAAVVCCFHFFRVSRVSRLAAYALLVGGVAVFLKEVWGIGSLRDWGLKWREFASLDMEQSHVREKLGSTLVWLAMGLQLDASGGLFQTRSK